MLKLWTHAALDPAASSFRGGAKSRDDSDDESGADASGISRARARLTRAIRAHPKLAPALPIERGDSDAAHPRGASLATRTEWVRAAYAGVGARCEAAAKAAVVAAANGVLDIAAARARGGGRDARAGRVGGCGRGGVRRRGEGRARGDAPAALNSGGERAQLRWIRRRRVSHEARRDAAPGRRAPLPRVRGAHRRGGRPQDGRRAVRLRRVLPSRRGARLFAASGESVGSRRRVAVRRVRVVGRRDRRDRRDRTGTNEVLLRVRL